MIAVIPGRVWGEVVAVAFTSVAAWDETIFDDRRETGVVCAVCHTSDVSQVFVSYLGVQSAFSDPVDCVAGYVAHREQLTLVWCVVSCGDGELESGLVGVHDQYVEVMWCEVELSHHFVAEDMSSCVHPHMPSCGGG